MEGNPIPVVADKPGIEPQPDTTADTQLQPNTSIEHIKPRNEQVISTIRDIEKPFFKYMLREYPEANTWVASYWQLCGPASIVLSRVLEHRLGVPLGKNKEGEHIELGSGLYDPKDTNSRLKKIEPHSYMLFYLPNNRVLYIDPVYRLHMEGHVPSREEGFKEAIVVDEFDRDEYEEQLAEKYHIYPFKPDYPDLPSEDWPEDIEERKVLMEDLDAAMYDERATMPFFIADSGSPMKLGAWGKTPSVIRQIEPEWKQNPEVVAGETEKYHQYMEQKLRDELAAEDNL